MSKTLWHTIQIQVPKEMVELTKSGKVSVKKTLTKTLNISRSQKTPAIKLIPSDVNKPHIVNDGKEWDVNVLKERMAKARAMRKKNANKDVFESKVKNMNPIVKSKVERVREQLEVKKNEFRTKKANMFHLNRRTKKGREEFNKIKDDIQLINDLQNKQTTYWNRKNLYNYFSYDDALALVELQKQINAIDKTQNLPFIKGSNFPKILKSSSGMNFGIIRENYSNR